MAHVKGDGLWDTYDSLVDAPLRRGGEEDPAQRRAKNYQADHIMGHSFLLRAVNPAEKWTAPQNIRTARGGEAEEEAQISQPFIHRLDDDTDEESGTDSSKVHNVDDEDPEVCRRL